MQLKGGTCLHTGLVNKAVTSISTVMVRWMQALVLPAYPDCGKPTSTLQRKENIL